MSTLCNFCGRKFNTHQALSSHYKIHKDLPVKEWVENGPRRSKIKTAHLKAKKMWGRRQVSSVDDSGPDEEQAEALSPEPEPLRAIKWVGPDCYVELPWLTQNPEAEPSPTRPPGPPVRLPDPDTDSDGVGKRGPLLDLNLPTTGA